jgi:hypothetical protein
LKNSKKKLIIHLGYPKTGSSFLKSYFASLNTVNYLNETETKFINDLMFTINSLSKNNFKKKKLFYLDYVKKIKFQKINIISWENLSAIFCGNYQSPESKIRYIKKIFNLKNFDISFILVTRDTKSHLRSIFLEFNYNLLLYDEKNYSIQYFCDSKLKNKNKDILKNLSHKNLKRKILNFYPNSSFYIFGMNNLLTKKKFILKFSKILDINSKYTQSFFNNKKPKNVSLKINNKWQQKNNFFRIVKNIKKYMYHIDIELIFILTKKTVLYSKWLKFSLRNKFFK